MLRRHVLSTLFPYTTLFRSAVVTDALFTDRGWGASSRDAAEFIASKYESEVATEDNVEIADIESTLRKYAEAYLLDRKSTRLNSSHLVISYAVFCLKKKKAN